MVDLANLFFIQISAPGNFPFFFGTGDDRAYGDLFTRLGSRREGAHEVRSNEQPSQSNDDYEPVARFHLQLLNVLSRRVEMKKLHRILRQHPVLLMIRHILEADLDGAPRIGPVSQRCPR